MDQGNVVAIGNFDGVHLGHQALVRSALAGTQSPLTVITFWPHPIALLRPDQAPALLTDLDERIQLLRAAGATEVRVVQFTHDVAELSPADFLERYVMPLHPVRVSVGQNFRFGKGARGQVSDLEELSRGRFSVAPRALAEVDGQVSSSSLIRQAVVSGDVGLAAKHLGRNYRFHGVVVVGDQRGRELGFPTANLPVNRSRAVPADGVYAGWLFDHHGVRHPAAISVGTNPTFDGEERRVEAHVLFRDDLDLYGHNICVEFVERLRGQITFGSSDELVEQMRRDVEQCAHLLDVTR